MTYPSVKVVLASYSILTCTCTLSALSSVCAAWAVLLMSSGMVSLSIPDETVSEIVVPTFTVRSASGVWLMTRPYSTVSLARQSPTSILKFGYWLASMSS